MARFEVLAQGLDFPEGPVVMPDGTLVVCEIAAGRLTRVTDKGPEPLAETGGGPNGALYVCNNGGFTWIRG